MRQDEGSQDRRVTVSPAEVAVEAIIANPKARLMEQVREIMRLRHYAIRTEEAYCDWIRRYVKFHGMRSREELFPGTTKVERLEENLGALKVKLTADDLSAIETASSHIKIEGGRYPEFHEKLVGR